MSRVRVALLGLLVAACSGGGLASPAITTTATSPAASMAPTVAPTATMATLQPGEPWLAYAWFAPGKSSKDIFVVRPDGSDPHVILKEVPGSHGSPRWSPDGTQLVFSVSDDAAPLGSIWTAHADGSGAALLIDQGGVCPDGVSHPSWSPDGSTIAFICYPDPKGKQGSVATFDLASGAIKRLVTVTWPEHLDGAPTWSPDGRSLAYSILHWDPSDTKIDGSLLAVVPAGGGAERRITTFDTNFSDPDWSPDGRRLATFSYDMGNMHTTTHASNLYLINPDGTGLRQLTYSSVDGNMRIVQPRWTPDGTRLVCSIGVSHQKNFTTDSLVLAFVDPAGGEPVLLSPAVLGSQPDLRPTPHVTQ